MARVDILLPVKNGVLFLAESIESIIGQSFKDWRLLILDHGSTDGSVELSNRYAESDRRICVNSFPDAKGLAGLLNQGLAIADCEYIVRQDADDISVPDRLDVTIEQMGLRPHCTVMGGWSRVINEAGSMTGISKVPIHRDRLAVASLFCNPISHPTVAMRLNQLQKSGARYGVDFVTSASERSNFKIEGLVEDYLLFGQFAVTGRCENIDRILIAYRRHAGSVGSSRFLEQMTASVQISRFLMHAFCESRSVPFVDPAQLCNHGARLFLTHGGTDVCVEFERLSAAVRSVYPGNGHVERELAFREVLASRNAATMILKYMRFRSGHKPDMDEAVTIREWLVGPLRGRHRIEVETWASEQFIQPSSQAQTPTMETLPF